MNMQKSVVVICRINAVPIRIPADFFVEVDKLILKFIWNYQVSRIARTILKKNNVGGPILSDLKTHYKATVIKTMWDLHKDTHIY